MEDGSESLTCSDPDAHVPAMKPLHLNDGMTSKPLTLRPDTNHYPINSTHLGSRHSFEPSVGKATRSWESRSRVNAQLLFHDLRSFIRECQCSDRLLRKFREMSVHVSLTTLLKLAVVFK
ncbi:hypothetical protein F2P81_018040 [Scophthalmus maximus]|uniref:Uncharacterized protein n=1 Tax=Scophthalmus maximus TaxID=52904 RepID=A0A6A4S9C2_SCOMX|nr:hypothetical protein F2P81_018040 [Scophthalmus maximus]